MFAGQNNRATKVRVKDMVAAKVQIRERVGNMVRVMARTFKSRLGHLNCPTAENVNSHSHTT